MKQARIEQPPVREQLLRLPEVRRLTGLSRSRIYDRMRAGEFPKSVRLGSNSVAWTASSIQGWIDSVVATSQRAA